MEGVSFIIMVIYKQLVKTLLKVLICETGQNSRIYEIQLSVKVSGHCTFGKSLTSYTSSHVIAVAEFITVTAVARDKLTRNDQRLRTFFTGYKIQPYLSAGRSHLCKALINRGYGRVKYLTVIKVIISCNEYIIRYYVAVVS